MNPTVPPTAAAAEYRYRYLCEYYQILDWRRMARDMKPEEWGWHIDDQNVFQSRWTSQPHQQSCSMLYVAVARKTVPQGGAYVKYMVCLALLFAMKVMPWH